MFDLMVLRLALRNVSKTLPKRLSFGSFFAATMALLFLGNTVFENSDRGLARSYSESFTSQASVSAPSPEQFTIFGSDLPLIGEFLVLPVLPDPEGLEAKVQARRPGVETLTQVSAAAALSVGSYHQNVPVFGVDLGRYLAFFPALRLVSGRVPPVGEPAILLTKTQADAVAQNLGRPLATGEILTLSFAVESSFITRQVAFEGVFERPVADPVLDRTVLTDPETARALNGYLYGAPATVLDATTRNLLTADLDSLFGDAPAPSTNAPSVAPAAATASASPWNFLLVKEAGRTDAQVVADLTQALAGQGVQVKDWRETAGGTAQIAWFLRILFNLGLLFIAIVSCLILINSLSLSILERTREIGTMRALGAERTFVGGLIAWETLILVAGTGLTGIAAGVAATFGINAAGLRVENLYISSLLGGAVLKIVPSWSGVGLHALLGLVLGLASVWFPVGKALSIQPVKAIARDQ